MSRVVPAGIGVKIKWWRLVQGILTLLFIVFAVWRFRVGWNDPENQKKLGQVVWHLDWRWIALSLLVTWVMYGVLISGWRLVLQGWGERLGWLDSARIWTVSSLGKYVPGKVWAIAGMAIMAQQAGVSPGAATGSAIVMQILAIASGATIALALAGPTLLQQVPGGSAAAYAVAAISLLATLALTSPQFMARLGKLLRRTEPLRTISPSALVLALTMNALAWAGYGVALICFARGTLPQIDLAWPLATGAFAASYLAGYLMFLAPGGLGIREAWLGILLTGSIGLIPALALAVASRVTVTINELGAAVPFLLFRRPPREDT